MNNLYLVTLDTWLGQDVIVIAPNEEEALKSSSYLFSEEDKKILKVFRIDMDNATPEIFQQIFGEHIYKHLWEKYTRMGGFICTVYRYLTAHGHDTTVSLTLYEDSDTRNLLWLIDQYAREAVMAKN